MPEAKYDEIFREDSAACGPATPEITTALLRIPPPARVLDLGCGQGRDALPAARHGHEVVGVDVSRVGIAQMLAAGAAEGLCIEGYVADVVEFEPEGDFDAVVLDRVLHMLPDDTSRLRVLETVAEVTVPGGVVLTAETPSHVDLVRRFFSEREPAWPRTLVHKGLQFFEGPR